MTKPLPIIIDTDPGQDDAVAILLALASPEFEVLGITAVAGNVPLYIVHMSAKQAVATLAEARDQYREYQADFSGNIAKLRAADLKPEAKAAVAKVTPALDRYADFIGVEVAIA